MTNKLILLAVFGLLTFVPVTKGLLADNPAQSQYKIELQTTNTSDDITRAVKDAFSSNRDLASFSPSISVKNDNGIITLSGTVDTPQTKAQFASTAASVPGVKQVVNNIQVKST